MSAQVSKSTSQLQGWLSDHRARRRAKRALIISVIVTALLYVIPFGNFVAYPLMLLSTLVHELGHGLAALFTGGDFKQLVIFSDGSGVAAHTMPESSPVKAAIISAGGLVGPAIAAALAFVAGRRANWARGFAGAMALFLALVLALWVRNVFGIAFTGLVAIGLGWVASRKTAPTNQIVVLFLAIQLALSVFSRGDYLFTDTAMTGQGMMASDTAHMAEALGGTYWMWGLACGAFSIAVLLGGIALFWTALRDAPVPRIKDLKR